MNRQQVGNYRRVERVCVICGARFTGWHTFPTQTCSPACKDAPTMGSRIAAWEARVGELLGPWLQRKYVDERWSYRQLGATLGITSFVTLRNLLRHYGIASRTRSESAAAAWASNPARRYRPRSGDAASASTP